MPKIVFVQSGAALITAFAILVINACRTPESISENGDKDISGSIVTTIWACFLAAMAIYVFWTYGVPKDI